MSSMIRPFVPADIPRMVEIINSQVPEPTTVEDFERDEQNRPVTVILERHVAVNPGGYMIGYGFAEHAPWHKPGEFFTRARVEKPYQRQGAAGALQRRAEEWAIQQGAVKLNTDIRENDPESQAWAERRGFVREHHIFESTLNLKAWNPEPFLDSVVIARDQSIRFTTLAQEGADEAGFHKYYELQKELSKDVPVFGENPFPSYADWIKWIKGNPRFRADAVLLAADRDRWVALSHLEPLPNGGVYQGLTAVDRAYRGRGISLAIKVVALSWAKAEGYPHNRTNNHSANAPMLATNRRLGYKPEPGFYTYGKQVLSSTPLRFPGGRP